MANKNWKSVCQWCGKIGWRQSTITGNTPNAQAQVTGKCPSHPSGNPNMPHSPRWEKA